MFHVEKTPKKLCGQIVKIWHKSLKCNFRIKLDKNAQKLQKNIILLIIQSSKISKQTYSLQFDHIAFLVCLVYVLNRKIFVSFICDLFFVKML